VGGRRSTASYGARLDSIVERPRAEGLKKAGSATGSRSSAGTSRKSASARGRYGVAESPSDED
jgi:hypothetical protein